LILCYIKQHKIIFFYLKTIVISIAGNKSDMYEYEEVKKEEALTYSKSIGASYHETSAKNSVGIDVIITSIKLGIILYNRIKSFGS